MTTWRYPLMKNTKVHSVVFFQSFGVVPAMAIVQEYATPLRQREEHRIMERDWTQYEIWLNQE
jgi:hypothetical protein